MNTDLICFWQYESISASDRTGCGDDQALPVMWDPIVAFVNGFGVLF